MQALMGATRPASGIKAKAHTLTQRLYTNYMPVSESLP